MRRIETYQAIRGLLTLPEWMPHLLLFLRDEAALAAAPYGVSAAAQVDAQSEGPDVGGLWTRLPQLFGIGPMASAEDPTYAMLSTLVPPQAPETADGGIGDDVPSQAERRASTADILAICEAVARTRASDDVCAALEGGLDDDMDLDCAWLMCGHVQWHTPDMFACGGAADLRKSSAGAGRYKGGTNRFKPVDVDAMRATHATQLVALQEQLAAQLGSTDVGATSLWRLRQAFLPLQRFRDDPTTSDNIPFELL